jgi:methylmalonyl-CoA carboxyltransferase large subunit
MTTVSEVELATTLEQLQAQMAELSRRMKLLEGQAGERVQKAVAPPVPTEPAPPAPAVITEEEILAISAAIGAYLGVRAHIRQIRLVSTNAWAQQGRVSIQASHRL